MTGTEPPYSSSSHPVGAYAAPTGNRFSWLGIALGVLGLALCPVLLAPAGVFAASVAMYHREPLWRVALGVSIVGIVGGLTLWIAVFDRVAIGF
ncbi:MAG: hypothetical protein JWN84_489 [Nocardioides sp.]|jgi:hypothetical protein|nr:hypothetical protein [Nocardioides sp.]